MEDPRAETSGFKESTPGLVSCNKGHGNERLAQAGSSDRQAEACAPEVGSEKRRRRVASSQHQTRLEAAAGAAAAWRQQQPNYVSYARRATKATETTLFVKSLKTQLIYTSIQSTNPDN